MQEAARSVHEHGPWAPDDFVASLVSVSPHTRSAYAHDVREFVEWAERGGCTTPDRLDRRVLRRYLAYLDTRGFARSSIARKAAAVRSYLRWLRRHGVIETDPGRGLRAPKGASRLPRVIRADEAADLLDVVALEAETQTAVATGSGSAPSSVLSSASSPAVRVSASSATTSRRSAASSARITRGSRLAPFGARRPRPGSVSMTPCRRSQRR